MLDSNTNKVTWVGIAVGIVALLGVATSQLYPEAFDSAKNAMTQTIIYQGATPHELKYSGDVTLSKAANNYEPSWGLLEYPMNFPGQPFVETKPGQWSLIEIYFKSDVDLDNVAIDVNNRPKDPTWVGNDHDNVADRKFSWYDENGKLLRSGGEKDNAHWFGHVDAGKVYRLVVRYHNTSDHSIYMGHDWDSPMFGVRPVGGVTDSSRVHMTFYNARVF